MADEKINVQIVSDYKDDDAKQAIKDAKEIENLDPELQITADDQATPKIADVADASGRLSKDDTVLVITAKIDAAKADLETLQGELHSVDDAAVSTGDKLGTEIEGGTSKASGAVHSMAGNVVGDSAAMATGFGPLGEALGQITEGALGGEVAMKELLTSGLALGAITVVVGAIQKGLEANKRIDAFNKKKVEDFTQALKDAHGELDIFNTALRKDDKIEFVDAADGQTKDLTTSLANAGITWDTFITQVSKGKDSFDAWVIATGNVIGAGNDLNAIIQAGGQFIKDRAAAQALYDAQLIVSGQVASETDRETRGLNRTYVDGTAAAKDMTREVANSVPKLHDAEQAARDNADAINVLTGALGQTRAIEDFQTTMINAQKEIQDSGVLSQQSMRDVEDSIIHLGEVGILNPVQVSTLLNEVTPTDVNTVFFNAQTDVNNHGPVKMPVILDLAAVKRQLAHGVPLSGNESIAGDSFTPSPAPAPTSFAPQTVNVNLPRGARHGDIARAIGVTQRRSGTRYQAVNYARR